MQSRRDLFQAHRLMTQRAALALLRGEPDIPDQPLRRLNVATFAGVLVAVIVTGLFVIWGLLGHGGFSLRYQPGTLVLDKQTGQPYVFCGQGKKDLCPMVNYASARLALDTPALNQQTVSQASLAKFPRGPLLGIPGLPPLPDSGLLVRQPWSVCTQTTLALSGQQVTTTLAGGSQVGGSPLGTGGLLVAAQGQDWLIWDAQRMPFPAAQLAYAQSVLSTSQTPAQVPATWLDALPQGAAFAPPTIADQGATRTGPAGSPAAVGQVYRVPAVAGQQFYVMLRDGLAPISQMQAALLTSEPGAPNRITLDASQVTGHRSASTVPDDGLPATTPRVAAPGSSAALCVVFSGGGGALTPRVETGGTVPPGSPTGVPGDVDNVALPPGTGALVGDAPGPGQGTGAISYFLVAGTRRYALASTEVAGLLGYSLSQAVLLPAGVVDRIPAGPALDPTQATKPVPSGG
jgi:type VII secretion protein EccB